MLVQRAAAQFWVQASPSSVSGLLGELPASLSSDKRAYCVTYPVAVHSLDGCYANRHTDGRTDEIKALSGAPAKMTYERAIVIRDPEIEREMEKSFTSSPQRNVYRRPRLILPAPARSRTNSNTDCFVYKSLAGCQKSMRIICRAGSLVHRFTNRGKITGTPRY